MDANTLEHYYLSTSSELGVYSHPTREMPRTAREARAIKGFIILLIT
jgi:hypothetical protein